MREPFGQSGASGEGALGEAARRFETALSGLEEHLQSRLTGDAADRDMTDETLGRLSGELSQARRREQALRDAAGQASATLGRAAAQVRAVLAQSEPAETDDALEPQADEDDKAE
jgi:hypothetical protein